MKRGDKRYWVETSGYCDVNYVMSRNYKDVCQCHTSAMAKKICKLLNKDAEERAATKAWEKEAMSEEANRYPWGVDEKLLL